LNQQASVSTSFLHHAFGIRDCEHVRIKHQDGRAIFTIQQEPETR
jgi:hypothetical protein